MTNEIRLAADALGITLMRNNSGVLNDAHGRPVRYGLGNESSQLIASRATSDWIGWTADGRFAAVEEKPAGWVFRGTTREQAQLNFISVVRRAGGFGCFATNAEDLRREYYKWIASSAFNGRTVK